MEGYFNFNDGRIQNGKINIFDTKDCSVIINGEWKTLDLGDCKRVRQFFELKNKETIENLRISSKALKKQ